MGHRWMPSPLVLLALVLRCAPVPVKALVHGSRRADSDLHSEVPAGLRRSGAVAATLIKASPAGPLTSGTLPQGDENGTGLAEVPLGLEPASNTQASVQALGLHQAGAAGSANATAAVNGIGQVTKITPQVFLLFMVYSKINNQDVWETFLSHAVKGSDYTALVHCKSEDLCRQNIRSHFFDIIPSVETRYCADLVGGMNALLKAALLRGGAGSPRDKFVFVSDSTLPVKPFNEVYSTLTANDASNFCIFPRNEWAEVSEHMPGSSFPVRVAVKHHQWMVLNRRHAERSVRRSGEHLDLMDQLQLNTGFQNTGCLDEFWHFVTMYDSLNFRAKNALVTLSDFNGGPISTSDYEIQGKCDTFVHWVPRANGIANNITNLAKALEADVGTDMVPPSNLRPATLNRLSRLSLVALRNSPFLFMRKVDEHTVFSGCERLSEAFDAIVFSSPPRPLPGTGQVWRGDGVWLDNRRAPVVVSSSEGALRLVGTDADMQAKGYYCGDRLQVTFRSGYKASAVVSPDGQSLHWENGVTWPRASDRQAPKFRRSFS